MSTNAWPQRCPPLLKASPQEYTSTDLVCPVLHIEVQKHIHKPPASEIGTTAKDNEGQGCLMDLHPALDPTLLVPC